MSCSRSHPCGEAASERGCGGGGESVRQARRVIRRRVSMQGARRLGRDGRGDDDGDNDGGAAAADSRNQPKDDPKAHDQKKPQAVRKRINQKKEKVAGCVDLLAPRDRTQTPAVMRMKGVMFDGEAGVEEREGGG